MTKSELAFRFSLKRLDDYTKNRGQSLYFWTFTFREDLPLSWCIVRFNKLMLALQAYFYAEADFFYGARVIEFQKSGRTHYHCIFNVRIPVKLLREYSYPLGFGWDYVEEVWNEEGAIGYLAKYLSKQYTVEGRETFRRFAMIGGFDGCKVSDIKRSVVGFDAWAIMRKHFGGKIPYKVVWAMRRSHWVNHWETFNFCMCHMKANNNDTYCFYMTSTEIMNAMHDQGMRWVGEGLPENLIPF